MDKDLTYTQAIEELEKIVAEIEEGKVSVDILSEKVKRASFLIKLCRTRLTGTEEDVMKILEDPSLNTPDKA